MKQLTIFKHIEKRQLAVFAIGLLLPLSAVGQSSDGEQIKRGEYLSRAANCMGCHTTRGGEP